MLRYFSKNKAALR